MRYTFLTKRAATCGSRVTLPRSVNYESNGDRWTDAETGKVLTPAQVQIAKRNALEYKQRLRSIGAYKKAAADAATDTAKSSIGGSFKGWWNGLSNTEQKAFTLGAVGLIAGGVGGVLYSPPKQRLRNALLYALLGTAAGAGAGAIRGGIQDLVLHGLDSSLKKRQPTFSKLMTKEITNSRDKSLGSISQYIKGTIRWCGTHLCTLK
jgi:hypothetical protein